MLKTRTTGAAFALLYSTACFDPAPRPSDGPETSSGGAETEIGDTSSDDHSATGPTSGDDTSGSSDLPDTGEPSTSTGGDSADESDNGTSDPDKAYRHSLQNVELVGGLVPSVEIHDSPEGKRYGMVTMGGQTREGYDEFWQGVEEHTVRKETPEQRDGRLKQNAARRTAPVQQGPLLSPGLVAELERRKRAYDLSPMRVTFSPTKRASFISTQYQMELAIGRGEVRTWGEANATEQKIADLIEREIRGATKELREELEAKGLKVRASRYLHNLKVVGTAEQISRAIEEGADLVYRADLYNEHKRDPVAENAEPDASSDRGFASTLATSRSQHDVDYLIDEGYDGNENGSGDPIVIGTIEGDDDDDNGLPNINHFGFRDGTSSGSSRIRGWAECEPDGCERNGTHSSNYSEHATRALTTSIGDLTDNQISGMSNGDELVYTGSCPECEVYVSTVTKGVDYDDVADYFYGRSKRPEAIHMNISHGKSCTGKTARDRDVDEGLYERGILLFKSSGNGGTEENAPFCTVTIPGAAHSVVTVGYTSGSSFDDYCDAHYAAKSSKQSLGGRGDRTIIDLVAHGTYRSWFEKDDNDGLDNEASGGSSFSVSYVTGAAASFMDMFMEEYNTTIRSPGHLKTWMLLMTDGKQYGLGNYPDKGFDRYYGGGRFRALTFTGAGLDSPYRVKSGSVCVDDGETVEISTNGALQKGQGITVATWSYSPHFNGTGSIQDIDLHLADGSSIARTDTSEDEKKKAFYYRPHSGSSWAVDTIELRGYDVTTDVAGCGNNSAKVYYAMVMEDQDRDDSNGPDWDEDWCIGRGPRYGYP